MEGRDIVRGEAGGGMPQSAACDAVGLLGRGADPAQKACGTAVTDGGTGGEGAAGVRHDKGAEGKGRAEAGDGLVEYGVEAGMAGTAGQTGGESEDGPALALREAEARPGETGCTVEAGWEEEGGRAGAALREAEARLGEARARLLAAGVREAAAGCGLSARGAEAALRLWDFSGCCGADGLPEAAAVAKALSAFGAEWPEFMAPSPAPVYASGTGSAPVIRDAMRELLGL